MEEKKTLILGAAGFIGTNLCRRLLEKENGLLLFDRPGACFAPFLQKALEQNRAQAFYGSFSDLAKEGTDQEIDALHLWETETVYHLISTTCPSNSNRDVAGEMEENLIATIRFLDACQKAGVKKVVFLSSGGTVYGREHHGICREEEEAFPITSYGVQKLAIERSCIFTGKCTGWTIASSAFPTPMAPGSGPTGCRGR